MAFSELNPLPTHNLGTIVRQDDYRVSQLWEELMLKRVFEEWPVHRIYGVPSLQQGETIFTSQWQVFHFVQPEQTSVVCTQAESPIFKKGSVPLDSLNYREAFLLIAMVALLSWKRLATNIGDECHSRVTVSE